MRRSRDGGGIRLSCSHVSQSDTRSVSWQEIAANLFPDNVFQVVSGIQPQISRAKPGPARAADRASAGTRARVPTRTPNPELLAPQTRASARTASQPRTPVTKLGTARAADHASAGTPSGGPDPRAKPGVARAADHASTRTPSHPKPADPRAASTSSTTRTPPSWWASGPTTTPSTSRAWTLRRRPSTCGATI